MDEPPISPLLPQVAITHSNTVLYFLVTAVVWINSFLFTLCQSWTPSQTL